jgi:hypothetical protein
VYVSRFADSYITWLNTSDVLATDSVSIMRVLISDIRSLIMETKSGSETYVSIIRLVISDIRTLMVMMGSVSETLVD